MGTLVLLAIAAVVAAELWRQYELDHAVNDEVAAYREVEARFPHVTNWDQYWQAHAGDAASANVFASAIDELAVHYESPLAREIWVVDSQSWLSIQEHPSESQLRVWLEQTKGSQARLEQVRTSTGFAWPVQRRHDDITRRFFHQWSARKVAFSRVTALALVGERSEAEAELIAILESARRWNKPRNYYEALNMMMWHSWALSEAATLAEKNLLSYKGITQILAITLNRSHLDAAACEGYLATVAEFVSTSTNEELAARSDNSDEWFHWLNPAPHIDDRRVSMDLVGKRFVMPSLEALQQAQTLRWFLAAYDSRMKSKPRPPLPEHMDWTSSTTLRAARAVLEFPRDDEDRLVLEIRLQWLASGNSEELWRGIERVMISYTDYEVKKAGEDLLVGLKDTMSNRWRLEVPQNDEFRVTHPYRRLIAPKE